VQSNRKNGIVEITSKLKNEEWDGLPTPVHELVRTENAISTTKALNEFYTKIKE